MGREGKVLLVEGSHFGGGGCFAVNLPDNHVSTYPTLSRISLQQLAGSIYNYERWREDRFGRESIALVRD